jgi:hypothetical protein
MLLFSFYTKIIITGLKPEQEEFLCLDGDSVFFKVVSPYEFSGPFLH